MSLINCPECNHQVSTLATSCPNCGAPVAKADDHQDVVKKNENILETNLSSSVNGTHSIFQKTLTEPPIKLIPFILKFIGVFIGVLIITFIFSNHKSPQQESANQKETAIPSTTDDDNSSNKPNQTYEKVVSSTGAVETDFDKMTPAEHLTEAQKAFSYEVDTKQPRYFDEGKRHVDAIKKEDKGYAEATNLLKKAKEFNDTIISGEAEGRKAVDEELTKQLGHTACIRSWEYSRKGFKIYFFPYNCKPKEITAAILTVRYIFESNKANFPDIITADLGNGEVQSYPFSNIPTLITE